VVFRACPEIVAQKEQLTSFGHAPVEFVHAHNPIPKVSRNRISCFSIQQSLRVTPAMEAGISDHVRSLEEMIESAMKGFLRRRAPAILGFIFIATGIGLWLSGISIKLGSIVFTIGLVGLVVAWIAR
jgi:hypothetical protein